MEVKTLQELWDETPKKPFDVELEEKPGVIYQIIDRRPKGLFTAINDKGETHTVLASDLARLMPHGCVEFRTAIFLKAGEYIVGTRMFESELEARVYGRTHCSEFVRFMGDPVLLPKGA